MLKYIHFTAISIQEQVIMAGIRQLKINCLKLHNLIHFNLKADVPFFQINGFTFFSSVMYVCDNHISWHYYALDIAQRCSSIFILQQFSKDFCQSRSGQRISMSTPKDSRCQNEDLPHSVVFKKRISGEGYLLLPSNLLILKKMK